MRLQKTKNHGCPRRALPSVLGLLWLMTVVWAVPSQTGDLDEDGRYTIRDVARLVNHLQQIEFLDPTVQSFADVTGDGRLDEADIEKLVDLVLEKTTLSEVPFARPLQTSPSHGENQVSLTREVVVRFSLPLHSDVSLTSEDFSLSFAGKTILSRVEISSDRLKATLFPLELMPASARLRAHLKGTKIRDTLGRPFNLNRDGQPGGDLIFDFDTLSVTPVPQTGMVGRVLASEKTAQGADIPLQGVIVQVVGAEETIRATTGSDGRFTLSPVPAGDFFVEVDGRPVTGQFPTGGYYAFVSKVWQAVAGRQDNLAAGSGVIYLPFITPGSLVPVSATMPTPIALPAAVLSQNSLLAGTEIEVPPNSLFGNNGARGGRVGIAPVEPSRLPEPLPTGLNLPLVITIQTDGATNFDRPVPVRFPNLPNPITGEKQAPGERSALWSFDHDTGRWEIAGPMTVTPDGNFVVTDPGVGVRQPGWHGASPGTNGNGPPVSPQVPVKKRREKPDRTSAPWPEGPFDPPPEDPDLKTCVTICKKNGDLKGGAIAGPSSVCLYAAVTFTASGVLPVGQAVVEEKCYKNFIQVGETITRNEDAGTILYSYAVTDPKGIVISGEGNSVSFDPQKVGDYTIEFWARSESQCYGKVPVGTTTLRVTERNGDGAWSTNPTKPLELEVPEQLTNKILGVLNSIPGAPLKLDEVKIEANVTNEYRKCCSESPGEFENIETQISAGLSLVAKGSARIWGAEKINKLDLGTCQVELTAKVGVFVDGAIEFKGKVGRFSTVCPRKLDCTTGEAGGSATLTAKATVEITGILVTRATFANPSETLKASLVITPLAVTSTIFANVQYNGVGNCDNEVRGNAGINKIVGRADVGLFGFTLAYEELIFAGKEYTFGGG